MKTFSLLTTALSLVALPLAAKDTPAVLGNPAAPLAGKVAGLPVHAGTGAELRDIAMQELMNRFSREKKVAVSQEEISAYRDFMKKVAAQDRNEKSAARDKLKARLAASDPNATGREKTLAELAELDQFLATTAPNDSPSAEEKSAMDKIADAVIRQWKVNQLLYQEFGGRIIRQQSGPEPLDAYRLFLESAQKRGDLRIAGESLEKQFWQYFLDDSLHDFYPAGSLQKAQVFDTPPWAPEAPANPK